MHDTTFDTIVRRAAGLQVQVRDRRSFLGGLSAALPVIVGLPLAAEAKKHKHKKRNRKKKKDCDKEKDCLQTVLPGCDLAPEIPNCKSRVKKCCEKACKSVEDARACIDDIEF